MATRLRGPLATLFSRQYALTRPFHTSTIRLRPATTSIPSTSSQTNTTNPASANTVGASAPNSPLASETNTPNTARHAAFLGEADSNDGFEANYLTDPPPRPALDATNAAFLGEADGDDGFEAHKDVHGQKIDAIDASASAYLGEADSDDGFEGQVEVNPDRFSHKLDAESVRRSGEHGQPGEGDQ